MKQTISGYIENPSGKGSAVFSNREMYRELYTKKFDLILLRENGKIDYRLYTKKDKYYIHLRIPSEVVPRFFYDIVLEFYTDDEALTNSRSLNNYYFRVYSNDPSFVFTYCKAFIDNDLFIKELESKMSKKAVRDKPIEKNPQEVIGYVKSLYFAYLWIKSKGLLNKSVFDSYASKLVWKDIFRVIDHADNKVADRQRAGEEIERQKRKEKEQEKLKQALRNKDLRQISSTARSMAKTKMVNTVSTVKSVKRTKTTKKI